jgi:hypothetical protein
MDTPTCTHLGQNLEELVHRTRSAQRDMRFKVTFIFEYDDPLIDSTLHVMKNKIFSLEDLIGSIPLDSVPKFVVTVEGVLDCYNVAQEDQEDEDPRNL